MIRARKFMALVSIWLMLMLPIVEAQSISNVQFNFNPSDTQVRWDSDVAATSSVDFGFDLPLDRNVNDSQLLTNHSLTIPTVSASEYLYRLTSCSAPDTCRTTPVANFIAGTFFLNANISAFVRSQDIDVAVRTRPQAAVSVFVNGREERRVTAPQRDVVFRQLRLPNVTNDVRLVGALNNQTIERAFQVTVDTAPPILNVTVPAASTSQAVSAKVRVSEEVNLTVEYETSQGAAPRRPLNVTAVSSGNNVRVTWRGSNESFEYGIYRNNTLVGVSSDTDFEDSGGSGNEYQYQVTAVNAACVESEKSDIASITTPSGSVSQPAIPRTGFSCARAPQSFALRTGTHDVTINLKQGENFVTFKAVDKAGFLSTTQERIVHDTGSPQFIEHNLQSLGPVYAISFTYDDQATVRGKLSEQASVTVFVNGKPQKTVATNADGTFDAKIKLERTVETKGAPRTRLDTGSKWVNKVKLSAVDAVGFSAETPEFDVDYALCGSSTKVDVQLKSHFPDMLNPRLLVEGIQEVGIPFTYKYRGGQTARINHNLIRVNKLALSPEFAKEWDNDLVQVANPLTKADRKKPEGSGYIQIKFNPITDPWQILSKGKESGPSNATMFDKEKRLSDHRLNDLKGGIQEGECKVPGLGCVKIFLELEIPVQEQVQSAQVDPIQRGTPETVKPENIIQRTCVTVEVPIDQRIPPKYIPKSLLEGAADALLTIIDGIDNVLRPIETIGKYLFYTCLAGTAISFVPILAEKYNCEYANVASTVTSAAGGGGQSGAFDVGIAEIGACEEQYADNEEAKSNCDNCMTAKEYRKKIESGYRQVCDRVMCPAVPSLQHYLKTKGRQPLIDVPANAAVVNKYLGSYKPKGNLLAGPDCAAWVMANKGTGSGGGSGILGSRIAIGDVTVPPRLFFTLAQVQDIYTKWLEHQEDTRTKSFIPGISGGGPQTTGGINCADPHPATPECCGYEYMREWSSGCGVSAINMLDTFDEIKESTCLSAEKANKNDITGSGDIPIQCNKLLNSVGGFCEPSGGEPTNAIPVGNVNPQNFPALSNPQSGSKEGKLYVLVIPNKLGTSFGQASGEYKIGIGYVVESLEFSQNPQAQTLAGNNRHFVTSQMEAIETADVTTDFFDTPHIQAFAQKGNAEPNIYDGFHDRLCTEGGYETGCSEIPKARSDEVYNEVMGAIGTPDKEYIIRAGDGLINSIRCICVPTLVAFLKKWKNILTAVHNCVNTILLTGDGSTGVCQAVVSQYACDLLYDAISCFTQKFSVGGGGRIGFGLGGDVAGALTSAGSELSRSVEGRYGETNMYKSIFVDRKLAHSVCMFAFTGTWNLDVGALFDQAVDEVPVESTGLIFPCDRRFVSFNPATTPKGLVTWTYHLGTGFAAGADADLELHLKCSGGFKCRESDGFARGKCDCDAPKDIVISPDNLPTRVKKGEIANEEIFFTVQGAPGESQLRYDSAYLLWRWNDGKQAQESKTEPCQISQVGGAGGVPSECRFDPATSSFRCQIGDATSGIRIVDHSVSHAHHIPQEVVALEEPVNVSLRLTQDYPTPADRRNDKHLEFTVRNQHGVEVASNKNIGLIQLTTNGDYTLLTSDAKFGPLTEVQTNWFAPGTGQAGAQYTTRSWTQGGTTPTPHDADISTVRFTSAPQAGTAFILEFETAGTTQKWTLFEVPANDALTVDAATGFRGSKVTIKSDTVPSSRRIEAGRISVDLKTARPALTTKRQVLIIPGAPKGLNPCDSKDPAEKLKAQKFSIDIAIFDSDQFGSPTDQVSIDPQSDEETRFTEEFFAVCGEADDLTALEQKVTGVVSALDKLKRITEIIMQMYTRENGMIGQLKAKKSLTDRELQDDLANLPGIRRQQILEEGSLQRSLETAVDAVSGDIPVPAEVIDLYKTGGDIDQAVAELVNAQDELTALASSTTNIPTADDIPAHLDSAITALEAVRIKKISALGAVNTARSLTLSDKQKFALLRDRLSRFDSDLSRKIEVRNYDATRQDDAVVMSQRKDLI